MSVATLEIRLLGVNDQGVPSTHEPALRVATITRSMGLAPDMVLGEVSAEDWDDMAALWDLTLPMSIEFGLDDGTPVRLDGYRLTRAQPPTDAFGTAVDGGSAEAQWVSLMLVTDLAWMREGRGGLAFLGVVNPLGADGTPDTGDPAYMTLGEIVEALLDASNLAYAFPSGDKARLDAKPALGPYDLSHVPAIQELEDLLARAGEALVQGNDGVCRVVELPPAGKPFALPSGLVSAALPYQLFEQPAARAAIVVVHSGRRRSLVLSRTDGGDWEWVWFDERTGRWLNGAETEALYPSEVRPDSIDAWRAGPGQTIEQRQEYQRVFRHLRLVEPLRTERGRFVALGRAFGFDAGQALAGTGVSVFARCALPITEGIEQWANEPAAAEDALLWIEGVKADPESSVISLPPGLDFVRMPARGHGARSEATAIQAPDILITWLAELNTGQRMLDHTVRAFRSDGWDAVAGQIDLVALSEANAEAATELLDVVKIESPLLTDLWEWDENDADPTRLNETAVTDLAREIVRPRIGEALAEAGTITLRGLLDVSPGDADGSITSVTWDIARLRTILAINQHDVRGGGFGAWEGQQRRSIQAGLRSFGWYRSSAAILNVAAGSAPKEPLTPTARGGGGGAGMDPGDAPSGRGIERAVGIRTMQGSAAPTVGPAGGAIWAKLIGKQAIGGADHRWVYTWQEVVWTGAGTFTVLAEGRGWATHGLAYNSMERFNSDTGIQGSGEDLALLADSDFAPVAIGAGAGGAVVLLHPVGSGETAAWVFQATNITTGACPEEEAE